MIEIMAGENRGKMCKHIHCSGEEVVGKKVNVWWAKPMRESFRWRGR
jgi:hypothetical protein